MARIVPLLGSEKESLLAALERHRDAIHWKLDGLTDEQLRASLLPSGLTPIGLVKHLGSVEYGWFCGPFERAHERLFGYFRKGHGIEVVTARLEVRGLTATPAPSVIEVSGDAPEPLRTSPLWSGSVSRTCRSIAVSNSASVCA